MRTVKFACYQWSNMLSIIDKSGPIYLMDFAENIGQMYKYESHHNKNQYSLHCAVKYANNDDHPYNYYYHLSDKMKRDFTFTSTIVDYILNTNNVSVIVPFKLDNCATQYKFIVTIHYKSYYLPQNAMLRNRAFSTDKSIS